jgi:hypothetical protein|tara:strand:+ start:496 stop:1053 length:558 start_codon:yes stop_codon:yes gene_type:complete
MALTVEQFYETGSSAGFSRDFSFRVTDINIGGMSVSEGDDVLIFARTASLPGREIEDKLANFGGHEFHLGGRAVYSNAAGYPIEFYCDEGIGLRDQFEKASRSTFLNGVGGDGFGFNPGAKIVLQTLSKAGPTARGTSEITLNGVSIRDIGDIDYTIADGTGEVVTFSVTFAYQFYDLNKNQGAG